MNDKLFVILFSIFIEAMMNMAQNELITSWCYYNMIICDLCS